MFHTLRKRLEELDRCLKDLRNYFEYPIDVSQVKNFLKKEKEIEFVKTDENFSLKSSWAMLNGEIKVEDEKITVEYNPVYGKEIETEIIEVVGILYEVLFGGLNPRLLGNIGIPNLDKNKEYFIKEFLVPKDIIQDYIENHKNTTFSELVDFFKLRSDLVKDQLIDFGFLKEN